MPPDNEPVEDDASADVEKISRRRTIKSFAAFGAAAAAGYGSWRWLMSRAEENGQPWPIRRVLRMNEKISNGLFRPGSRMDEKPPGSATTPPRMNTDIGVDESLAAADYRLHLLGLSGGPVTLTLDQLKAFPKVLQTTRLCCVEGWSTWGNWAGTRLVDVVAKYPVVGTPGYVGMSTPSDEYYVGLDTASALHPQTILVYEIDNKPLTPDHGFPVRLVVPTKYGIKNIKQVSRIEFTSVRPRDYWAERGYDWFAGL